MEKIYSENELSYIIRGAIFKVYNILGPGLLESVYVHALCYELRKQGCDVKTEFPIPVYYEGHKLNVGFRVDLLVENKVIVEVKSIEAFNRIHYKQLLNYLKLSNLKLGLMVNFNVDNISRGIIRKVNNL